MLCSIDKERNIIAFIRERKRISCRSLALYEPFPHNGDTHLRSQMYVAAFASIRYNAACRETYERLRARGKSGKLAVVAVANKLIRQAFAVVTNNQPYIDGFVSSYA